MPIGDLIWSLLLAVLAGLTWYLARWVQERAMALWLTGWGFLLLSGAFGVLGASIPPLEPFMHLLGPLMPAFLLAGALACTGAAIPVWLPPATIAIAVLRWGAAELDAPLLAHAVGLGFEPPIALASAFVVHRFTRAGQRSRAERLLAPAFVGVAIVEVTSALSGVWNPHLAPPLLATWAVAVPVVLGVQITVALERQRALRLRQVDQVRSEGQERLRAEEERRRMDEHLRELQHLESLGVLSGQVAHDFNNLLTVILGNTRSARREIPSDSPALRRLSRIETAGQQARGLVEQMLTYAGKASLEPKPVQLSYLVEEILELLEISTWKKARLLTDLDPRLPTVEGDQTQLRQVLLNLITNASEAVEGSSGTIHVRTGVATVARDDLVDSYGSAGLPEGDYVFLEVEDTGPGIDEQIRSRIFEPFFTTKASGRGLGLAATLGIVQAHRGTIQVTSEAGRGTTFRVLLPRAEHALQPATAPEERVAAAPATGGRVLVVDDEEAVLELATEFLQRDGFQVVACQGGEEALALLRDRPDEIDAILLDLIMPDCDGEETLRELRHLGVWVPVVVATGYIDEKTVARFSEYEVAGWIAKPYEPDDLTRQLHSALHH